MKFESVISETKAKGEQVWLAFDHNGDQLQLNPKWLDGGTRGPVADYVFLIRVVSICDGCPFCSRRPLMAHVMFARRELLLHMCVCPSHYLYPSPPSGVRRAETRGKTHTLPQLICYLFTCLWAKSIFSPLMYDETMQHMKCVLFCRFESWTNSPLARAKGKVAFIVKMFVPKNSNKGQKLPPV